MATITIKTVATSGAARKIVVTQPSGATDGTTVAHGNESFEWIASTTGEAFRLYFFDYEYPGAAIWPFDGSSDGSDAKGRYWSVPSPAKPRRLRRFASPAIKYDVVAMSPADVDPLDPMIIIRPTLRSKVLFGLAWAALGAVAGSALTWYRLTT
jgi:hypothetical protein